MAAKRTKDIHFLQVRAPLSLPCSEPACHRFVVMGEPVVCIVMRNRYSWSKPDKAYKCQACSQQFLKRVKAAKKKAAIQRATRTAEE